MKKKLFLSLATFLMIASLGYTHSQSMTTQTSQGGIDNPLPSEKAMSEIESAAVRPSTRVAPPEEDGDGGDLKIPLSSPGLAGSGIMILLSVYYIRKKINHKHKTKAL